MSINPVFRIRKGLLTFILTLKASLAGIILGLSDLLLLIKSSVQYLWQWLMGIRQSPEVVTWNGFPSVLEIPAKENVDFNFWRKPTYILPTLKSMVRNKVNKLLQEQRPLIMPDRALYDWVMKGPLSRIAQVDGDYLDVDLSVVRDMEVDKGVYFTGPRLRIHTRNNEDARISFKNGESYGPDDGALWSLSKLHFQACTSFLLPGRFHGNIHFGLPCVAAASLHTLNKSSVLYQMLAPHLRFTLRINNEALRVQRAQDRSKAYAPFPMTGDEFVKSIAGDVKQRTMEPGFQCPPWSLENKDLAFNQFGQAYYDVIRGFVADVLPSCDPEELTGWQSYMNSYIPNFKNHEPLDAIATIIWQVSFLHSVDHFSMDHTLQAGKHVLFKVQLPEPGVAGIEKDMQDEALIKRACLTDDAFRSRVFKDTFVKGHKHFLWSNTMDNIQYKFKDPELKRLAKTFQSDLLETQKQLEQKGINICPLNHVFQSICW